jgi:hypothetical protein
MRGCLKDIFAGVGCVTLLVFVALLGWHYRAQVGGAYHSLVDRPPAAAVQDSGDATGHPSAAALASAHKKQGAIGTPGGPAYVTLDPNEMASLIAEGLGPAGAAALDSVSVILGEGRFAFHASLKMDVLGPRVLGPFAAMFGDREPVAVSGPARVAAVGAVAWQPDSVVIRAFPFPHAMVPIVINRLTGRPDGIVPIPVPATVGDLRIRPSGVTFYRKTAK